MSSNESVKDNNSKVEESATNADADTCVVCFKNVEIYSIGECDHPVCHECSTRMRVLCQQNECPICRHVLGKVIFTYEKMPFRELEAKNRSEYYSKRYKIGFYTNDIQKRFFELLDHPCPKCNTMPYRSFQGLRDHVRREHNLHYCDLCVDNLKIFTFERRCYTQSELNLHRTKGDVDNKSHRGHPLCEYCNKRYLDRDELFRHLRREHYFCHFCDADGCNEFYRDYDALAEHFRQDHYLCEEGKCATEQFVGAFRTDIDYKAHVASVHGKTLNKQQAKQTRTLQLEITLGPRGRGVQAEQNLTNIRSGATNDDPNEEIEQFPLYAQQHYYSHQRPLNIDSQNVQDFPSLSSGNVSSATTAPLVPFPMRRGISAGFSRTKENFPALGSSSTAPSTSQRSSQQQPKQQSQQQQQQHQVPPISTMVKRTMNPATNPSSTTNGPLSNGNNSNMVIHVSNRPTTAQTGNGAISKKSATPKVDFPALPMGKAKKNQQQPLKKPQIIQQSQQQSFHQLHQQQLQQQQQQQHQQQQQQQQHQKQQHRSLEEDMLPAASSNLPTSSVAAKHRGLVDDYVSVANPKTFQKIQTVQQQTQADTQASTKERIKAVPKLNSEDFPSLCNNSVSNGPPISWTKSISEKKLREQENRKAKVAPAPQLPTSKEPKISLTKLPNDPNTKKEKCKDKKPDTTTTNQSKSNAKLKEKQSNNNNNNNNNNNDNEENKQDRNLNPSPNGSSNNNNNNSSNISRDTADVRPPPGFNKENPTSNPVGVPPPGFLSNVTVNSVAKSPNSLTFTSSMGESYSIIPKHQYLQPPDSSTRNQKLVENFQNVMRSAEGFQQFHLISQKFREGFYKADAYYEHCQSALGADFDRIFPELLVLLPNILKQQALYLVHAQRLNMMAAEDRKSLPQLEVCSMCKQVLLSNDIIAHHKMHDFPAIGKPNVPGKRK